MNDLKNLTLAWVSSTSSVFAAIEAKTLITITSAIILPIVFFALGKTVDVVLQIYLKSRDQERGSGRLGPPAAAATESEPGAVATGEVSNGKG